jgi:FkbM family methyltransferase
MSTVNELVRAFRGKWNFLSTHPAFRLAPMQTTLRLASWRTRCLLRMAVTVHLRRAGVRMFLPPNWRGIGKLIFAFRENYEPELTYLEKILSRGKIFVDAGANFGVYTLVASKIVGETGRVLAFEPSVQSFPVLRHNIALNALMNASAYRLALSEKSGKVWLYHGPGPVQNSLGRDPSSSGEGEVVDTESLDNALRKAAVGHVDVIKMDVEGAEEMILRGAMKTLNVNRPVVIFEVNEAAARGLGLSPQGAKELLRSLDYEFFATAPSGTLSPLKSLPAIGNVVAIYGGVKEKPGGPGGTEID